MDKKTKTKKQNQNQVLYHISAAQPISPLVKEKHGIYFVTSKIEKIQRNAKFAVVHDSKAHVFSVSKLQKGKTRTLCCSIPTGSGTVYIHFCPDSQIKRLKDLIGWHHYSPHSVSKQMCNIGSVLMRRSLQAWVSST